MIVNFQNYSFFQKANLIKDNSIELDNSLIDSQIEQLLYYIIECEDNNKKINIKISLNDFSVDQIILVFKYFLKNENILKLRNITFLTNILVFLRNYNSFDDSFFENKTIFINSIEQFLDVKLNLKETFLNLKKEIFEVYMSLCKSYSKQEYSILDTYEDIPSFYYLIFTSTDLPTIFSFFNDLPLEFKNISLKKYKNAKNIIDNFQTTISIGNFLIEEFKKYNNDDIL